MMMTRMVMMIMVVIFSLLLQGLEIPPQMHQHPRRPVSHSVQELSIKVHLVYGTLFTVLLLLALSSLSREHLPQGIVVPQLFLRLLGRGCGHLELVELSHRGQLELVVAVDAAEICVICVKCVIDAEVFQGLIQFQEGPVEIGC